MAEKDLNDLTKEDYRQRAKDPNLSVYEKIGLPESYRLGKDGFIFEDIYKKLHLGREGITLLDLGCGCSDLTEAFIANSKEKNQTLLLNDCQEMIDLIQTQPAHAPDDKRHTIVGWFPQCKEQLETYAGKIDAILTYSTLHSITVEMNPFTFIDEALNLLRPGGMFLLGDIRNTTKRNRYFQSEAGRQGHKEFAKDDSEPPIEGFDRLLHKVDDGLIFGIMQRYRSFGFETYLLPQPENLPFGNRREDILIVKR